MRHPTKTLSRVRADRQGRRLGLLALTLMTLGLSLLLFAGTASAIKLHRSAVAESFGPDGTSASSFVEGQSLALQRSPKRLFALNNDGFRAGELYGFDSSFPGVQTPLSNFDPLAAEIPEVSATAAGVAVDDTGLASAGNVYVSGGKSGAVFGFSSAGSPLPGWPIAVGGEDAAADAVAVDPAGNVWLSGGTRSGPEIREYTSSGVPRASIKTSSVGLGSDAGALIFNSDGDLYAAFNGVIWKYPAPDYQNPIEIVRLTGREVLGLALDRSSHTLYAAGGNEVKHFSLAGALLEEFGSSVSAELSGGIAVDPTTADVFVSTRNSPVKIYRFGAETLPLATTEGVSDASDTTATLHGSVNLEGLALTDCHFEYVSEAAFQSTGFSDLSSGGSSPCAPVFGAIPVDSADHPVSAAISGLDPGSEYHYRLLAANANGSFAGEGAAFRPGPPGVETTGSPLRTATTARLEGRVYPHSLSTTYHFEYGDEGPCDANPCTVTEAHDAGSGNEVKLVSQLVQGLEPNTPYHYRVIADNANPGGPVAGEDMSLSTFASDAPLSHGRLPGPPGSDRAWEQVNAPDTGGNPVAKALTISGEGNRAVYRVYGGTPLSETGTVGTQLFAERTPSGWQTRKVYPAREEATESGWLGPAGPSDLSTMIAPNFPLNSSGEFSIWSLTPNGPAMKLYGLAEPNFAFFFATSEDLSGGAPRVLVTIRGAQDPQHPTAAGMENLYDVGSGSPQLIDLLPDGTVPACGVSNGLPSANTNTAIQASHWISADGSSAFFQTRGNNCNGAEKLYMRDFEAETTRLISTPPVSGTECDSELIKSIPGAVFFYTESRLVAADTESAGCSGNNGDVYRYDLADGGLTCLTCVVPGRSAEVEITRERGSRNLVSEIGIAEDGSRIYFTSASRLLPGTVSGGVYRLEVATGNLAYVGHLGLPPITDIGDGARSAINRDGSVIVFASTDPSLNALNGPQNGGTLQYYRYDDRDRSLTCISCPADGSPPAGAVSGTLGSTGLGANTGSLSEDGEDVVFATPTALVGADQNTAGADQNPATGTDIYEWRSGKQLLISDGLTNWPVISSGARQVPEVDGITPSGRDVFFTAAAQYTQDALDGYTRLYDARIGGGFEFPPPPKPCSLEVCQGTPKGAPEEQAPGTKSFTGPGNSHTSGRQKINGRQKRNHRKHAKHTKKSHLKAKHNRRAPR